MVCRKRRTVTRLSRKDGHLVAAARRCLLNRYCTPWMLNRFPVALGKSTEPSSRDGSRSQACNAARVDLASGVHRSLRPLPTTRTCTPAPRSVRARRIRPVELNRWPTGLWRLYAFPFPRGRGLWRDSRRAGATDEAGAPREGWRKAGEAVCLTVMPGGRAGTERPPSGSIRGSARDNEGWQQHRGHQDVSPPGHACGRRMGARRPVTWSRPTPHTGHRVMSTPVTPCMSAATDAGGSAGDAGACPSRTRHRAGEVADLALDSSHDHIFLRRSMRCPIQHALLGCARVALGAPACYALLATSRKFSPLPSAKSSFELTAPDCSVTVASIIVPRTSFPLRGSGDVSFYSRRVPC
jgi:hypothetical protein